MENIVVSMHAYINYITSHMLCNDERAKPSKLKKSTIGSQLSLLSEKMLSGVYKFEQVRCNMKVPCHVCIMWAELSAAISEHHYPLETGTKTILKWKHALLLLFGIQSSDYNCSNSKPILLYLNESPL